MKNICIIAPEFLPVPAVKGGAIETLIQNIIDENEIKKRVNIVCITIYNKDASLLYSNYKYTRFIPIKLFDKKVGIGKVLAIFNYAIKKILKYDIRSNSRRKKYEKAIRASECESYIFEYPCKYLTKDFANILGVDNIALHLHNIYEFDNEWRSLFGKYIVLSKYCKNKVLIHNNILAKDITVIYNGIDFKKFQKKLIAEDKKNIYNRFSIPLNKKIIIFTGRLMNIKGVEELILAFKNMKRKNDAVLFLCGGNEYNRNNDTKYVKKLKDLAKGEQVIFTGYIPNNELYKYYKMSDIAVFPSTGEEGLGNVVIEAMYCKLPTIISDSGGMPELVNKESSLIVTRGKNFIYDLSSNMDILVGDESLRKKMGKAGFNIALKFSSEDYYNDYVECILKNL